MSARKQGTSITSKRKVTGAIRHDPDTPLYKQVVAVLRDEILKGVYPVSSQLPTEGELCERFDVSRHTVREALRELRASGLVESRRGSGTTVVDPASTQSYVHQTGSIMDLSQYAAAKWQVLSSEVHEVDAGLAKKLGSVAGTRWIRIEAYRFDETTLAPVCWTQVYLHSDYGQVARLVGRHDQPLFQLIEDLYGERVTEVTQVLSAREAPSAVATLLKVPKKATVIAVERTYQLATGKVIEFSTNLYPADKFSFAIKLRHTPHLPSQHDSA